MSEALYLDSKPFGERNLTVLIDSWTWVEYWRGGRYSKAAAEHIEGDDEAIISTINLAEVYGWVLRFYDEKKAEEKRTTLEKRCYITPVDTEIAIEAAKIKRRLRLALADSLILATARRSKAKVVTGDYDFKPLKETIFIGEGSIFTES